MKKIWITLSLTLIALFTQPSAAQSTSPIPSVANGRIERLVNLPSKFVDARHIDVWLPDGYTSGKRYNVLYMHDGQMLFDASTTWNKQAWEVDVTVSRLIKAGRIPETIVVGIWNNGKFRHTEYFPQKFLPFVTEPLRAQFVEKALQGKPRADDYLRFIVEELKPSIDRKYSTRSEVASTFIMGSSMGGMISIYAMNEYPQVFGGAAGLSTHWMGGAQPNAALPLAAFNYLRDHLANPANHRLYMDHGTTELDAGYAPYQRFIDEIVRDRGYDATNSVSRVFDGAGHNERDWAKRLEIPILFLMAKQ
jgi:enterochelin esterase-like enzyme